MNTKRGISMEGLEDNIFPKEEWDSLIREEKCENEGDFPLKKCKWHPVAREEDEQKALEKADFYNRILLKRSGR